MSGPKPPSGGRPDEPERVVIRDKRKFDPITGERRPAGAGEPSGSPAPAEPAGESGQVPMVEASLLDERTLDLQRVQAEYANYRKRTERDRLAAGDVAVNRVLAQLLPVLDNLERARAHGDLTPGLKALADQLDDIFDKLGLVAFGEVGDPFDPSIHEAVLHQEAGEDDAAITVPTCTMVMRAGYRHNDRLLRAAMVGVTDPAPSTESAVEAATANDGEPAEK